MKTAYLYMWEYVVARGRLRAFKRAYGPSGAWVRLFRTAPGFIRTELYRDRSDRSRFVTIDYWESERAWRAFRSRYAGEFQALDADCEKLTASEREIGRFDGVEGSRGSRGSQGSQGSRNG